MKIAFTGHRPNKLGGYDDKTNLSNKIKKNIIELLNDIYDGTQQILITGMALGVDTWVAEIAKECGFPFHAYIPFRGQESKWPKSSQDYYRYLLNRANRITYICDGSYAVWKMQKRNEAMVNDCDILIAVWDGSNGGTANCINYAQKINKKIIQINPKEF